MKKNKEVGVAVSERLKSQDSEGRRTAISLRPDWVYTEFKASLGYNRDLKINN